MIFKSYPHKFIGNREHLKELISVILSRFAGHQFITLNR